MHVYGIIIVLLIVGVTCMVMSVYQEKIADPDLDDYHMAIPTGKYEWRSRNLLVTSIGVACLIVGAILTLLMVILQIYGKEQKEK